MLTALIFNHDVSYVNIPSTLDTRVTPLKPYHHGNLLQTLLDIAEQVLQENGPEALSVRGLAERAGVSRAAPYRHFADKRELEAAVAGRGFNRLCEEFLQVQGLEAERRVEESSKAILTLAREHSNLFKLMFFSDLLTTVWDKPQQLVEPADRAFFLFDEAVAALAPNLDPEAKRRMTMAAWSTVHGYATLLVWNRLKPFMLGNQAQRQFDVPLLRAVTAAALAAKPRASAKA